MPKKPAGPKAMTGAERVAALRARRRSEGLCIVCKSPSETNSRCERCREEEALNAPGGAREVARLNEELRERTKQVNALVHSYGLGDASTLEEASRVAPAIYSQWVDALAETERLFREMRNEVQNITQERSANGLPHILNLAGMSRAARRCTAAAEQKCSTGMMRKNQIGSRARLGQEQGFPVLE